MSSAFRGPEQTDVHPMVAWCFGILLIRYGAMFVWDSVLRSEPHGQSIIRLMMYPYLRALWLAAAFAAGFVLAALYPDNPQLYFTVGALLVRFLPEFISALTAPEV